MRYRQTERKADGERKRKKRRERIRKIDNKILRV